MVGIEAPGAGDDFTPVSVASAAHRIKYDTSPLYLGDITASDAGVVYVRAVINNVHISNNEVVASGGTTQDFKSVWCRVSLRQQIDMVDLDGREIDASSTYPIYDGENRGEMTAEDYLDPLCALVLQFEQELDPGEPDTITVWIQADEYQLSETETTSPYNPADDSKYFRYVYGSTVCTIQLLNYVGFDEDELEALEVTVHYEDGGEIYVTDTRVLKESELDSLAFVENSVSVCVRFFETPSASEPDRIQVFIEHEDFSEAYAVVLTETTEGNLLFRNENDPSDHTQITIVGSPDFSPDVRDEIEVLVSLSDYSQLDDSTVVAKETGNETLVFATRRITGQDGGDYDELLNTDIFKVRVKRFPAVAGAFLPFRIRSQVDELAISPTFDAQVVAYLSAPVMAGNCDDAVPEVEGVPEAMRVLETPNYWMSDTAYGIHLRHARKEQESDEEGKFAHIVISDHYHYQLKDGSWKTKRFFATAKFDKNAQWIKFEDTALWVYYGIGLPASGWSRSGCPIRDLFEDEKEVLEAFKATGIAGSENPPKGLRKRNLYMNTGMLYESFVEDLKRFRGEVAWPKGGKHPACLDMVILSQHGSLRKDHKPYVSLHSASSDPKGVWRRYTYDWHYTPIAAFKFPFRFKGKDGKTHEYYQKPVFVYLGGCCVTAKDSMTIGEPVDNWRLAFNARALVGWNGVICAGTHGMLAKKIYEKPDETLVKVVGDINAQVLRAKDGTGEVPQLKAWYKKLSDQGTKNWKLWARLRFSRHKVNDTCTFRLGQALEGPRNW